MQSTTNFKLKKIELTDSPPDITVINPNWDAIDTNLKEALTKAKDWDSFKKSGGLLMGTMKFTNYGTGDDGIGTTKAYFNITAKEGTGDQVGLLIETMGGGNGSFHPWAAYKNKVGLGTTTVPWKDIFAGVFGKSRDGYDTLPNGVIIQWGKASFSANTGGGRVTFPLTFPTECYTVLITNVYANSKSVVTSLGGTETTNSLFYVYLQDVISNARPTYACTVSWLAIGS